MKRLWSDARSKAEIEGCRVHPYGGCVGPLETAHVVGRKFDREVAPGVLYVDPDDVVGLCQAAHRAYDQHQLDLMSFLSYREQAAATKHIGIERARKRLAPSVARAVSGLEAAAGDAARLDGAA